MAVRIRNCKSPHRTIGLSTPTWKQILKLALTNGWQPFGSVLPETLSLNFMAAGNSWQNFEEQNWEEQNWEDLPTWQEEAAVYPPSAMLVTYFPLTPDNGHADDRISRIVLLEDALNFTDALDKAFLAYEPVRVPASYFLFEPDDPVMSQRPSLGALAAALDVCRQGSFSIEPWRNRVSN